MGLKKIKHTARLADEVYDQLLAGISSGLIDRNERIIQERLADELDVSRTPVREALIRLEYEGLLVRSGRSGYAIRHFTEHEISQVYSAREAVECHALGVLCQMKSRQIVERLYQVVERQERQQLYRLDEYYEANKTIHRTFVAATGNRFLLEMFDQIWNRSVGFLVFAELASDELSLSLNDHLDLCEVVKEGDAQAAVKAMRQHIRDGLDMQKRSQQPMPDAVDEDYR